MMDEALRQVSEAIADARAKHGPNTIDQLPMFHRVVILTEEVGEVARAAQEIYQWTDDAREVEAGRVALRVELAQVAACALMWLADALDQEVLPKETDRA